MKEIRVSESDPESFLRKLRKAISGGHLGAVTQFDLKEDDFCIRFTGFGESRIWYKLERSNSGFTAVRKREKIAFIHIPLRSEMEKNLGEILRRLGAEIA
ncbi:hypothetical protein CH373_05580 [Leptospira perolatii]|uniref:Uncharacterized protein n=1 Tax=Leptospira perolatii TaxID=2023191 RepID=A0A2M9ZR11_9LEPT|nr:hypothetical protein [Leptospira perolatii]PJZ70537.1 hypothetical protein CH360_06000 [Leptospira perolatii]PJZ74373.1 hypothetical protein CH373_05580 [Leptospira perolatii]